MQTRSRRGAVRRVCAHLAGLIVCAACTEQPSVPPLTGEEPGFAPPDSAPQLALVLSSGGLRGFAHVGVLKVLEANGVRPDLVVGSSVGALVGGVYASGRDAAALERIVGDEDFRLGAGWFRWSAKETGQGVHEFIASHVLHRRIEHFPIGFAAVATDLERGCTEVFNRGSVAVAVQASAALPGAFAPTVVERRSFVDGGLTSPAPVRVARILGAKRVIAVNVTFPPEQSRLNGVVDRLFQVGLVMARTLAVQESREADLLIEPILPPEDEIHLDNRAALIAAGERAAWEALPRIRELLATESTAIKVTAAARASAPEAMHVPCPILAHAHSLERTQSELPRPRRDIISLGGG